jgi:1,2-beta-oligoglucan phosphorylase
MSLILRCFLGLRWEQAVLVVDPVIPARLDGLQAELAMAGHAFEVTYRIAGAGCGTTTVHLNGVNLPFSRGETFYRIGAAAVPMQAVLERLIDGVNRLRIQVG